MLYVNDSSRVWHVAKSGNDANSGHAGQYPVNLANDAKLTIGAAVAAAAGGDTIIIWPGTYNEQIDASSKVLNFLGTNRELCKIYYSANSTFAMSIGSNTSVKSLTVENPQYQGLAGNAKSNLRIEDCHIISAYDGLYLSGAQNVYVKDCCCEGTYDGANFIGTTPLLVESSNFNTNGSWDTSLDNFRGAYIGGNQQCFRHCNFTGTRENGTGGVGGVEISNAVTGDNYSVFVFENCTFRGIGAAGVSGLAFGIRVGGRKRTSLINCVAFSNNPGGTSGDIASSHSSAQIAVLNTIYNSTSLVSASSLIQTGSGWSNAMAVALFANGAANKLKIDAAGAVDASNIGDIDLTLLHKAAKMLLNKAVQDKLTGAIQYFDDDGQTVIATHTPDEGESSFTRTAS